MGVSERVFPEETKHWEWFWFSYVKDKIAHLANTHHEYQPKKSLVEQHAQLHAGSDKEECSE